MINIKNIQLKGEVDAISSKSMAHRYLIASSLSDKASKLYLPDVSNDIQKTIDTLINLGADIRQENDYILVNPIDIAYIKSKNFKSSVKFNMGESGTTLRFMLPIVSTLLNKVEFVGSGRLPDRPIKELIDIMKKSNVIVSNDRLPLKTENRFSFTEVSIAGDVSSQYISGLLLASPLQDNDVKINIIGKIESKPYIDMTVQVMKEYGVNVVEENCYIIKKSRYISSDIHIVESDWSNSAFFLVAGAISEYGININNLNFNSYQGDMKIIEILKNFGAKIYINQEKNSVEVRKDELIGMDIDVSDIPDLFPILAVLASACNGVTRMYNASRLRLKESDRIKSTADMINSLGGIAIEEDNSLIINGRGYLQGGKVYSYNDHRIAMSASIASIICKSPVILIGEQAVNKSYINFYEDFEKLGGKICPL